MFNVYDGTNSISLTYENWDTDIILPSPSQFWYSFVMNIESGMWQAEIKSVPAGVMCEFGKLLIVQRFCPKIQKHQLIINLCVAMELKWKTTGKRSRSIKIDNTNDLMFS